MDTGGSFTEIIVNPVVHPLKLCSFANLQIATAAHYIRVSARISCSRAWTTQLEVASLPLHLSRLFISPILSFESTSLIVSEGPTGSRSLRSSQNNSIASANIATRIIDLLPAFQFRYRAIGVASLWTVIWLRIPTINMIIELLCSFSRLHEGILKI